MAPVSIVIITKSAGDIIDGCIAKARKITDDIIIICNEGSNSAIVYNEIIGCKIYNKAWNGYGANKNKGVDAAKYNWILSIDADEIPDDNLIKAIHLLNFDNPAVVYDLKFRSYFGKKPIRFGSWGRDHHVRLFNRKLVKWSETMVHETLVIPEQVEIKKVNSGCLHHYSVKNVSEYDSKGAYYAKLSAKKYFKTGKKASFTKLYLSPVFGFVKNYIIYLGFLDGREGWEIAKTTVKNTRRKYHFLSQMENRPDKKEPVKDSLVVEY
jgi:glycosyltransferase involved in cell wall biosynthesis